MSTEDSGNAEARIQELIRERNGLRAELQEMKATVTELTDAVEAEKVKLAPAVEAAKAEAGARLQELEGQLRKSSYRELLTGDKIKSEDMDEIMEYLDYQYGKVAAPEGGERPEFKDWYGEARKSNKVLRAAMRTSVRDAADAEGAAPPEVEQPQAKAATRAPLPKAKVEGAPADSGRSVDLSKLKLGTAEWTAAKDALRQQVFRPRA